MFDCSIIGGGIVGLAVAHALSRSQPGTRLLILEKESDVAGHQTGHNSGVIHSGIYYKPGSFKAQFAREGSRTMVEFCQEHGINHEVCGKVIVASDEKELPLLENLFQRGLENGLPVTRISPAQVREIEPHVRSLAGIKVPTTGIANYRQVCLRLVELIQAQGGTVQCNARVHCIEERAGHYVLETAQGRFESRFLISCAGLHSDRVARLAGVDPRAKIVPFRGEYYELIPSRRYLVKTLIYPVPNPSFPFLGVHLTRMIDGTIHAGPNAVLAFAREGYRKADFSLRDLCETLTFVGFLKLARRNLAEGLKEMHRSFSKRAFLRSLQRLIPELRDEDITPTHSGVRAQALMPDGNLVDDFLIVKGRSALHVCNAPSPAATASLEIGKAVANQVPSLRTTSAVAISN